MEQKWYLLWLVYRPSPLCTKNFKGIIMFLHGQKGQNVEVIFWVKKVKRSRSLYENHKNLLYLKHFLPIMHVSPGGMVLNTLKRHLSSYLWNWSFMPRRDMGEPYLWNCLRYRAIIMHDKFFNGMYQHIQK